jgi:hypothetical protein
VDDGSVVAARAASPTVPSFGANQTCDDLANGDESDEDTGYVSLLRGRNSRSVGSIPSIERDIRGWSLWLFGWGVVSIVMSGMWGIAFAVTLALAGVCTLLFSHPAMYVVLGVLLAYLGLSNLLGAAGGWSFFGIIQIVMAVNIFRRYAKARSIWKEMPASSDPGTPAVPASHQSAEAWFPWIGLGLAGLAGALLLSGLVLLSVTGATEADVGGFGVLEFELLLAYEFSVLALGICLASLLSRFRPRIPAAIGLGLGGFFVLVQVVLFMLPV